MKKKILALLMSFGLFFSLISPRASLADGVIMPPYNNYIYETNQKALIFWNEEEKEETMVLAVGVTGKASNFGWVVPVPSKPEVEKGDAAIFETLYDLTLPKENLLDKIKGTDNYYGIYPTAEDYGMNKSTSEDASSVEVVEEKRVGVLDVAVLSATDAEDLDDWLKENEYKLPGDDEEYVLYDYNRNKLSSLAVIQDYLDDGWYFIASKVDLKFADNSLGSQNINPLRITFETNEPVFPMKLTALADRSVDIALYVIADHKMNVKNFTNSEDRDNGGVIYELFQKDTSYSASSAFDVAYAELLKADAINDLTSSLNKGAWFKTDRKMFLTKLSTSYFSVSNMNQDLILEDAKNNKEVNSGKMTFGNWLVLPLYLLAFGPYNLILNEASDSVFYEIFSSPLLLLIVMTLTALLVGIFFLFLTYFLLKRTKKRFLRFILYFLQVPGVFGLANLFAIIPTVLHVLLLLALGMNDSSAYVSQMAVLNVLMTYLFSLTFGTFLVYWFLYLKPKDYKFFKKKVSTTASSLEKAKSEETTVS